MSAGIRPEALLEEATWLKRLAFTLAGDSDDADDLVQESWIAAWRARPDSSRPLRPWLAKVVRDQSRMRRRADSRRTRREGAVAESGENTPSPEDVLEQVRLHRLLTDLVLELDEPYRSTILARFVEGLTSAAIANRLGIPESTVRSRVREALARLRSRLDHMNGERKAWAPAVLAFASKGGPIVKSANVIVAVLALLALLLGGIALWWRDKADEELPTAAAGSDEQNTERMRWKRAALGELRSDAHPPGWFSQEGAPRRRVAGTVLVDGKPVGDARVRLEDEAARVGLVPARTTLTGPDGRFDFGEQVATRFELGAYVAGRVATVTSVDLRDPRLDAEHLLLALQPCLAGLRGKILDSSAGPIHKAEVLVRGVIGTESTRDGLFQICVDAQSDAPEARRILVRASGYGSIELIAPLVGIVERDLALSPEGTLTGRVVDERGAPMAMANVRVAWDEAAPRPGSEQPASAHAVTDPDGRFMLTGLSGGRLRVEAIARGFGSTPVGVALGAGEVHDLRLVMTERAVLRGRITQSGKPVAGVRVFDRAEIPTYLSRARVLTSINEAITQADGTFVLDGVPLGERSIGTFPHRLRTPMPIEVRAGEQDVHLEIDGFGALAGTVSRNGSPVPHSLVHASGRSWTNVRTVEADAHGHFELDGLEADDYELYAYNAVAGGFARTASRIHVDTGVKPNVDIELRFGARISGTVVDTQGARVAGAVVRFSSLANDDASRCLTDSDGRFACKSLMGKRDYRVEVSASEVSPAPFPFVGKPPPPVRLTGEDDEVKDLVLDVDARSVRIKGIVTDHNGEPLSDVRVVANPGLNAWASIPTAVTNMHGEFELRDLPPGLYALQAQALNGAKAVLEAPGGSDNVRLVVPAPSCESSSGTAHGQLLRRPPASLSNQPSSRVAWDDKIQLIGWEAPKRVRAGETFHVTLIMKVIEPLDRSWKIFMHMDGPKVRLNGDHEPIGGQCLSSTWKRGDVIVDRAEMHIDHVEVGTYDVWIGFFSGWEPSWKNLRLSEAPVGSRDGYERYRLTRIEVGE